MTIHRRVVFAFTIALAFARPLKADPTTSPATGLSNAPPSFLSGIVTLADGLTPPPRVFVLARPVGDRVGSGGWLGQTDADGNFIMRRPLHPGTYRISVTIAESGSDIPLQELTVASQTGPIGLRLRLPSATLHGKVIDAHGQPVVNGSVMLADRTSHVYYNVKTVNDGTYTITHVLPGAYDETGTSPATPNFNDSSTVQMKGLKIGTDDKQQNLTLIATARRNATTQLVTTGPSTARATTQPSISGTVTLSDGMTPIPESNISGTPRDSADGAGIWVGRTDRHGAFTVIQSVKPGTYRVTILEHLQYVPIGDIVVRANAGPQVLKLQMPSGSATGRIVDYAGRPVEGANVQLTTANVPGGPGGISDASGIYHIEHVLPGTYEVMATRYSHANGVYMLWDHQTIEIGTGETRLNIGSAPDANASPSTQP